MPVLCPSCSNQNPDGALFCVRCGASLSQPVTSPAAVVAQTGPEARQTAARAARDLVKRCERCNTANDGAALFCHHCGWNLSNSLPSSVSQLRPAGFWIRLAAYLLDVVLLVIVIAIGVAASAATGAITQGNQTWSNIAAQLGTLVYFTLTVGLKGASAGKWLLGLRIIRANGSRVSVLRSFFRYVVLSVVFLPMTLGAILASGTEMFDPGRAEFSTDLSGAGLALLLIGALVAVVFAVWIGVSEQKRGWHDLIAGTRVVRVR